MKTSLIHHKGVNAYLFSLVFGLIGIFGLAPLEGKAQNYYKAEVIGNDTVPVIDLQMVRIMDKIGEKGQKKRDKYKELVYDVREALPYANLFASKMKEIDSTLKTFDDQEKREQYLEREEKKLKDDLEAELKDLTYDQGRILIKLINRKTGKTSYELIKRYKSGFSAFTWQSFARVFSMDLKQGYDKDEEEALEKILKAFGED